GDLVFARRQIDEPVEAEWIRVDQPVDRTGKAGSRPIDRFAGGSVSNVAFDMSGGRVAFPRHVGDSGRLGEHRWRDRIVFARLRDSSAKFAERQALVVGFVIDVTGNSI